MIRARWVVLAFAAGVALTVALEAGITAASCTDVTATVIALGTITGNGQVAAPDRHYTLCQS